MAATPLHRTPVVAGLACIERVRRLPPSFTATLHPKSGNRYFLTAIAVHVDNERVGYLALDTNQDPPDKASAAEMANVGAAVATSAWFLASATPRDADAVVTLLADAAARRLGLERRQGIDIVARASTRADAEATEPRVVNAWIKWYGEALDSVLTLPANGADDALRAHVAAARAALR